jgi:glucuronoarabinoxylan endo-1,4-beta-xylanase
VKKFILAVTVGISLSIQAQLCTVDWNAVHQRIDGFGASSAFLTMTWTPSQANLFFSTNYGIGLSLLRTQIQPGGYGNANEIALMQMAQARGARIWSTPWTPQASFKSNNNTIGGNFLSASNQAYANQLAGYVAKLTNFGIHLYALSIQNEPDANVNYVSCSWSAQQFHDFIPYLYNALVANNVGSTKIIFPESESWYRTSLEITAMADPAVAAQVGILANHNYDGIDFNHGATGVPNAPTTYGKPLWETEVSTGDTFDGSITNAIYWAGRVHLFMTVAQANAWHYWWLIPWGGTDNQGLTDASGNPAKRLYAVGQFSRFVRPNYYRIAANTNAGNALISAYKDSVSPGFAIVAINPGNAAIPQTFTLTNFTAVSVTPWLTSSSASLAVQTSVLITNSTFTYQLPAMSVVTFVGQQALSNAAPQLKPIADQWINSGQTLVLTNTTLAPLAPSQTLTFSLFSGPSNATLGTVNGVFTWRPSVNQAGTTNDIIIIAADNSTPSQSATNRFSVVVNPLTKPTLSSISIQTGSVRLMVNGTSGPDYTLATSTNLMDWQVLFSTNSPVLPMTLDDTNSTGPANFYRIQIGP